ncbi:histidine phosphatase family protein [Lactiplantibacillus plantarum]|uniref:histidine phosphatase family protein n=1 Tax=Lactiplantibacillus plantarum TaxID=1590 RepID=UPI0005FBFD92|nr:histidine phosphatase family protein [Lactiplantibacillus plantarum]MBO2728604.1 histidine phosphatase family protein [Lactiplantibacillus plantarum]MCG0570148.1 putative phosphoglycerate mutase (putative) [Lactiplantibacillus plantarum]MCG0673361.1 putative phosphoglycerate mutase (putative) [Lactiplantibacillus plantarum]MCG0780503.1 putative phosphoglycerate mutase (putative) [Lactiplantibacillus plantarum]MCG0809269.1 putative phosphoglycerate mutase (putative) [Lactiplantibacillus plan
MAKTLYMMRHGETLFNRLKKIQGACDSPLTPKGIADAQRVGAYFQAQGITFDHAYSSTQERASDTLELVTKQPYERLKGIKEWNFGVFEGESEVLNPKPDPVRRSHGDFFCQYGGESDLQVQERVVKTLTAVMARPNHQQVLAVSHGGASFMFLRQWLSMDEIEQQGIVLHNCAVIKYQYDAGRFTFEKIINLAATDKN